MKLVLGLERPGGQAGLSGVGSLGLGLGQGQAQGRAMGVRILDFGSFEFSGLWGFLDFGARA